MCFMSVECRGGADVLLLLATSSFLRGWSLSFFDSLRIKPNPPGTSGDFLDSVQEALFAPRYDGDRCHIEELGSPTGGVAAITSLVGVSGGDAAGAVGRNFVGPANPLNHLQSDGLSSGTFDALLVEV